MVRMLKSSEYAEWDCFVMQSPQGSLFALSEWLQSSGEEPVIYGCFRGSELVAGLPLVSRSLKFGFCAGTHPPLTPYLGVLFKGETGKYVSKISVEKEISRAIAKKLKEEFSAISFNFSPGVVDLQPFIWEGFSSGVRYTYILNLNDIERVWTEMEATRRRNIRRAEKDGICVEDDGDFEKLFGLVEKTFQRQKMKVQFREVAFRYHDLLKKQNKCRVFLARDREGVPIAGVYIVWDWNRSYYLLGGYDPERSHHGSSALAMWAAIRFTKEELGLSEFDFEGSMIPQVEQFFRKFGGRLTPYYLVSWMRPALKAAFYVKRGLGRVLKWRQE